MPASRQARATTLAPRSCPSRPGLATSTRIGATAPADGPIETSSSGTLGRTTLGRGGQPNAAAARRTGLSSDPRRPALELLDRRVAQQQPLGALVAGELDVGHRLVAAALDRQDGAGPEG